MQLKWIALLGLGFVVLYNIFFFRSNFGLATGFLFVGLNSYFYLVRSGKSIYIPSALVSSATSILFAFFFAWRDNTIIQMTNILLASFFALVALYFYKLPGAKSAGFHLHNKSAFATFNELGRFVTMAWKVCILGHASYCGKTKAVLMPSEYKREELFQPRFPGFLLVPLQIQRGAVNALFGLTKKNHRAWKEVDQYIGSALLRGLVIALPLFILLFILLMQADPIFEKLSLDFLEQIGERAVVSMILFLILFGYGIAHVAHHTKPILEKAVTRGKAHELSIIVGSVSLLFLVFIVIQFRYLFAGIDERELHAIGITSMTYSEYVRKGFFELLLAASIAGGVITYVLRYVHQLLKTQKIIVQGLSVFMGVETLLMLFSAAKRLSLYVDAHGLTRAREFGTIFLVWLGLLLLLFIIQLMRKILREVSFAAVLSISIAVFLSMNIINLDALIATTYPPTVNGEVDYYYTAGLSTDAAANWIPTIEHIRADMKTLVQKEEITPEDNRRLTYHRWTLDSLSGRVDFLEEKYGSNISWQTINLSEYRAYLQIMKNQDIFKDIPLLQGMIYSVDLRVTDEVRQNTRFDRHLAPPFL